MWQFLLVFEQSEEVEQEIRNVLIFFIPQGNSSSLFPNPNTEKNFKTCILKIFKHITPVAVYSYVMYLLATAPWLDVICLFWFSEVQMLYEN